MDILEMARELGKKIQEDENYIRLITTQKEVEDDDALQESIADFNMKRYDLTKEVTKENRDDAKVDELDKLVRSMYDEITNNPKMVAYNEAQADFDDVFEYVIHILQMSASGEDPYTVTKPENGGGCSGDCGSCGGCG